MYNGGIFYRIEDRFHGIIYREDKTGAQLTKPPPCIHKGGAVREKFKRGKHRIKIVFERFDFSGYLPVLCVGSGDTGGDPFEEVLGHFNNVPFFILFKISFFQYL